MISSATRLESSAGAAATVATSKEASRKEMETVIVCKGRYGREGGMEGRMRLELRSTAGFYFNALLLNKYN